MLAVTDSNTIFASSAAEWIQNWPHDGNFTVEEDTRAKPRAHLARSQTTPEFLVTIR